MDALAFLDRAAKSKPQPVYVLTGDEAFLKRQVQAALTDLLLGEAHPVLEPGEIANPHAEPRSRSLAQACSAVLTALGRAGSCSMWRRPACR